MTAEWTVSSTLDWTAGFFQKNGIPDARLEAELLLASVLKCPRLELHLRNNAVLAEKILQRYRQLIVERKGRKPLSYILGEQEFMGLRFAVNRHTLIPRPETELLVEETVKALEAAQGHVAVDLGTGSGNIPVSVAKLSSVDTIYSVDISREALEIAQENVNFHGLASRVVLKHGDLFEGLAGEGLEGRVDAVISNPPYIPEGEYASLQPELAFEPKDALIAGKDGLEFYRRIAEGAQRFLRSGGYLLLELNAAKADLTAELVREKDFVMKGIRRDYAGLDRVLVAQKN